MYVITFYSFKGGVGRTMALVNVAAELVRRGRTVLIVDFDLEAPGLETYKHLRPKQPHPGIVEYVTEFRRTQEVPDLREYIYEAKPIGKRGGRLWVMPAGRRDRAYRNALTDLDWKRLYQDQGGFLLFEDTKKGWEEELKPNYVLIDSRTGDTDVLGICTRQLPDSVVLMFTPNEQNLAGLENVCRDIRREETEGLKKKVRLHFVAANVPDLDDEHRILRRQLQAFRERLEFTDLSGMIRRCESLSLLDQTVLALDRPHSRLARSYRRLVRTLLKDNLTDRDGALTFLKDYPQRNRTRRADKAHLLMIVYRPGEDAVTDASSDDKTCLHRIARHFSEDLEMLTHVADCFMEEEAYKSASNVLDQILRLEPNRAIGFFRRAICKANLFQLDDAAEDLLRCLRVDGEPSLKRLCLERLAAMPSKLAKLAEMVETEEIQGLPLETVVDDLCRSDEGVPIAARLLRTHMDDVDEPGLLWLKLLHARCWREVIELSDAGRLDAGAQGLFGLALARWAENGELPESLCRQILESDVRDVLMLWGDEAIGWLLWRVGEVAAAVEWLERAEQRARAETECNVFSLWRLRDVSVEQYLDDSRLVRRMFQGEPLRPAFLGPPRSPQEPLMTA